MSTSLISWHPLRNQLLENCDQCVADEGKSISVPNVTPSLANRSGPNEMTGKRWIAGANTTDRQGRLSLHTVVVDSLTSTRDVVLPPLKN